MNKTEIDALIDNYFKWLKDKTASRVINDAWTEITTPYLDRHNDYLQIYAKKEGDFFYLTDDGYILNDLEISGCNLDSPRRKAMLKTTLNGFGVNLSNGQLSVKATVDSFSEKKHELIQAMISVNDMFYAASSHVQNLFLDDVVTWFDSNDIRYIPDIRFVGKSGFDNHFDFGIAKSKNYSERIVQTITNPTKESAMNLVFKWIDTKDKRPQGSSLIALVNNIDKTLSSQVNDAFKNYDVKTIPWTERQSYTELLAS